ncbi:MAG: chemotaxis-specific protein-glutamate methyltransferase CheB [Planctomycetota bacterium]
MARKPLGVLVVEDSPTVRRFLRERIEAEPDLYVAGEAGDGASGVELVARLHPDVIVIDIRMPRLDGVELTRRVMATQPTPILVFCARSDQDGVQRGFEALQAGAMALIEKPHPGRGASPADVGQELVAKLRVLAGVRAVTRRAAGRGASPGGAPPAERPTSPSPAISSPSPGPPLAVLGGRVDCVAIGASTGGPAATLELLRGLPADLAAPVLVAQHMTPGFMGELARWLDRESALGVGIATGGERPQPGRVYLAPDDQSLSLSAEGALVCDGRPAEARLRPSVDLLFRSVAERCGSRALGVLLSGMGQDGVEGLRELYRRGGLAFAQDPTTCVVASMPQSAIEGGFVSEVLAPAAMGPRILRLVGTRRLPGP